VNNWNVLITAAAAVAVQQRSRYNIPPGKRSHFSFSSSIISDDDTVPSKENRARIKKMIILSCQIETRLDDDLPKFRDGGRTS
jgi:hypothetical protein